MLDNAYYWSNFLMENQRKFTTHINTSIVCLRRNVVGGRYVSLVRNVVRHAMVVCFIVLIAASVRTYCQTFLWIVFHFLWLCLELFWRLLKNEGIFCRTWIWSTPLLWEYVFFVQFWYSCQINCWFN